MKKGSLPKQFRSDLAALAAYEPRKRAIEWIRKGDFDAYLDWAFGEGYQAGFGKPAPEGARSLAQLFEPIPLDWALIEVRLPGVEHRARLRAGASVEGLVAHFNQSPFEIALRAEDAAGFSKLLALWASPGARYARGGSDLAASASWLGPKARSALFDGGVAGERWSERMRRWKILLLPFLIGKPERADQMVRAGLSPGGHFEWSSFAESCSAFAALEPALAEKIGGAGARDGAAKAADWGWERMERAHKLEKAADQALRALSLKGSASNDPVLEPEAFERVALELVEQGAPVDYLALCAATELGKLDLLSKFFEAGADPNCRYKTGVPMLARLDGETLTAEAVEIWMKAGCRPAMDPGSEEPFGNGMNPSALYQFVWSGRLDLLKACAEHAQGPLAFTEDLGDGRVASGLLALAIDKGHEDLAAWLVEEKGCRLDHLCTGDGEIVRGFAKGQMLARLQAIEDRLALRSDPSASTDKGSKPKRL